MRSCAPACGLAGLRAIILVASLRSVFAAGGDADAPRQTMVCLLCADAVKRLVCTLCTGVLHEADALVSFSIRSAGKASRHVGSSHLSTPMLVWFTAPFANSECFFGFLPFSRDFYRTGVEVSKGESLPFCSPLCLAGLLGGKIPFPAPFCALLTAFLAAG